MTNDLQVDERKAAALPGDWPRDFGEPDGWTLHTCQSCIRTFRSLPTRPVCQRCAGVE